MRRLLAWYLTEQAALQKIQPHQSLQTALINSRDRPGAKAVHYNVAPGSPSYSYTTTNDESAVAQQPTSPTDPVTLKSPSIVGKRAGPGTRRKSPKETEVIVRSDNDEAVAEDETPSKTAQWSDVDKCAWQMTVESVRKVVVPSARSGLQIVPYGILHARPFLPAIQHGDLLRTLTRHQNTSSHIIIRFVNNTNYAIDNNGIRLRYYGWGPAWRDDSCFWDSIIVSCLFLNTGFTYLDRGVSPDIWENELTTIQSAFLDVIRVDWNFFDTKPPSPNETCY